MQGAGASRSGGGMDLMTAGAMAGGSFLSNYLQMKAQEEAERKKNMLSAMQNQQQVAGSTGAAQNDAMSNLMAQYKAALLGG